jgi:hypothetical protein
MANPYRVGIELAMASNHAAVLGALSRSLFQFLNEIGARALGRHMGRVLEMAESSVDKWEYEGKIARRFGFAQQLELPILLPKINEAAN